MLLTNQQINKRRVSHITFAVLVAGKHWKSTSGNAEPAACDVSSSRLLPAHCITEASRPGRCCKLTYISNCIHQNISAQQIHTERKGKKDRQRTVRENN